MAASGILPSFTAGYIGSGGLHVIASGLAADSMSLSPSCRGTLRICALGRRLIGGGDREIVNRASWRGLFCADPPSHAPPAAGGGARPAAADDAESSGPPRLYKQQLCCVSAGQSRASKPLTSQMPLHGGAGKQCRAKTRVSIMARRRRPLSGGGGGEPLCLPAVGMLCALAGCLCCLCLPSASDSDACCL